MSENPNNAMKYASLATQWMVMMGGGVWLGLLLDRKIGTTPLFLILFPLTALFVSLWKIVKEFNQKK